MVSDDLNGSGTQPLPSAWSPAKRALFSPTGWLILAQGNPDLSGAALGWVAGNHAG